MKKRFNTYGILVIISAILIGMDQYTKHIIRTNLEFGQIWMPWQWLEPYARIIHINNTGAAFGLFKGANTVFMILAVLVAGAILYYFPSISKKDWLIRVALSMQFSGAIGTEIWKQVPGDQETGFGNECGKSRRDFARRKSVQGDRCE